MKIILLKDVRGIGLHGEVKTVADGYATNFLFPHKFAEPATEEKVKNAEAAKSAREEQLKKEEEALNAKVVALKGKKVTLQAKATEKGGLFKTISTKEIAKAIAAEHSLDIPVDMITSAEPIKTVGDHAVTISGPSQKTDLTVTIAAAA